MKGDEQSFAMHSLLFLMILIPDRHTLIFPCPVSKTSYTGKLFNNFAVYLFAMKYNYSPCARDL